MEKVRTDHSSNHGGKLSDRALYWNYWGKARPRDPDDPVSYHLLAYHCLDVVAVGSVLFEKMKRWRQLLIDGFCLPREETRSLLLFLLGIHDLGKFSIHFQKMSAETFSELRGEEPERGPWIRLRHDALGLLLMEREFGSRIFEEKVLSIDTDFLAPADGYDLIEPLVQAVTGHHGRMPAARSGFSPETCFPGEDLPAAWSFVRDLGALFRPDLSRWQDYSSIDRLTKGYSLILAGFTIICDWLGSNQAYFPYKREPSDLAGYFEAARAKAERAVDETDLVPPPPAPETGFHGLFPDLKTPTDLQRKATEIPLGPGSHLFIVEDMTGSGKTEAALTLAHRIMVETDAEGILFGLPTMATADQMYDRMAKAYERLFVKKDDRPAALILAHGKRHLSKRFRANLGLERPRPETVLEDEEESASATCSRWLADHTKKSLLGAIGVCTVDQIMLSVLRCKHNTLRLIGLANKVLIVDEIHAYDAYMRTVIKALIRFQARFGGSVLLLSATLPRFIRDEFVAVWQETVSEPAGRGGDEDLYPLLTHLGPRCPDGEKLVLKVPKEKTRTVEIRLVENPPDDLIAEEAGSGKCVCWIRNTVQDCLDAYARFRARPDIDPERLAVFHARFAMGDRLRIQEDLLERFNQKSIAAVRAGWIVIATQVVEQSLDLDFDRVFSDLAPYRSADPAVGPATTPRAHGRGRPARSEDGRPTRQPRVYGLLSARRSRSGSGLVPTRLSARASHL